MVEIPNASELATLKFDETLGKVVAKITQAASVYEKELAYKL